MCYIWLATLVYRFVLFALFECEVLKIGSNDMHLCAVRHCPMMMMMMMVFAAATVHIFSIRCKI